MDQQDIMLERARLSVFVISYNRADVIATCLRAVTFADEVILIDKSSTDDTVARAAGLVDRVVTLPWSPAVEDTRGFALTQCAHEWILFLDDDECLSPEAVAFIDAELRLPRADIYELPMRHYILGEHDERAYYWPEHHVRLFRRGSVGFQARVHGGVVKLSDRIYSVPLGGGECIHHLSSGNVEQWFEKTNRYTSRADRVRPPDGGGDPVAFAHARIDAWQQRGRSGGSGQADYPAVVALLRATYDIVDRLKIWEEQRGLDGAARFAEICHALDAAHAADLAPIAKVTEGLDRLGRLDASQPWLDALAQGRRAPAGPQTPPCPHGRSAGTPAVAHLYHAEDTAPGRGGIPEQPVWSGRERKESGASARQFFPATGRRRTRSRVSELPVCSSEVRANEAAADETRRRLEEELAQARRRLDVVNRRMLANAHELALAERRLRAMEASTFWRASGPARALADRFPGLTRRLSRTLRLLYWTASLQLRARLRSGGRLRFTADPVELRRALQLPDPARPRPVEPADITIFPSAQPEVSVIIPTHGQVDFTLRCLRSIADAMPETPIEVIVAEDASGDPAIARLREVKGITLIENPENLGFLRSCNAAAKSACGRYLLFLNNDTEVLPDAIDALARTLADHPDAGLVGARLVYPDGRLQEAGGIVWNDGTAWNYGRFDDPRKPEYNYLREADYCSGAAILIPTALFAELGGFDDAFAPAYYEDTDIAFRLRSRGHKVLYQPAALVVHHEGISHGTDTASGGKAYQVRNQALFLARWNEQLRLDQYENGTNMLRARDRARDRPVVLVVDHYVPEPDRDAGSRTILDCIRVLLDAGWVVKFWPENQAATPRYTEALQAIGVEVLYGDAAGDFDRWMAAHGKDLDYALLSRPTIATRFLPRVRALSRAAIVYYGHDLHFARLRLQAEVTGNRAALAEAEQMERAERRAWRDADLSLYLSDEERDTVAAMEPDAAVRSVVPYTFSHFADRTAPPADPVILFVAGFAHPPNVDAAIWFAHEILPLVRARRPDVRVVLAGSNPTPKVRELAGPGVDVTGFLSDADLAVRYASARVAVVPLRFGAGVKLKVVEALREGLPLVTTPVGVQGLAGLADIIAVHDEPQAFAASVLRLLDDDATWSRQSLAQTGYARGRFSATAMRDSLLGAFRKASERQLGISEPVLGAVSG